MYQKEVYPLFFDNSEERDAPLLIVAIQNEFAATRLHYSPSLFCIFIYLTLIMTPLHTMSRDK